MTIGAILVGVATIVFALSLHLSLGQVAAHLIRGDYVHVNVRRSPQVSDRRVVALLQADPQTARFVAETVDQVVVPGIAEPIRFIAYRGASPWLGYALIHGRWFARAGEVVAPTKLLAQAHLSVGQTITAHLHGRAVHLRLVGEILDQSYDDLLLRGDWATLAAVAPWRQPTDYEVALNSQAASGDYVHRLRDQVPDGLDVWATEHTGINTAFLLLNSVIAGLALILTAIAVAGVFNTVILTTREKVRDVAILKALGMAPPQVVVMVVASVVVLGLIAGILGLPIGLELHRQILQFMGQIAIATAIPARFFDLIDRAVLPLLALSGVAVAALGAWLPAQWAASSRVAEVLQAE